MLARVLLVTSGAPLRKRLADALADLGLLVAEESSANRIWLRLGQESFDLVVGDAASLPPAAIAEIRELPGRPEVIALSGPGEGATRGDLQAAGVFALIPADTDPRTLRETLASLVDRWQQAARNRMRADQQPRSALDDFSSRSPAMKQLLTVSRKVADADSSLLILGETGVGKEWLARAIHAESPRAHAPFVPINCAALPEALLESELFGHEKGAFTGAIRDRRGCFELAHQGTLFLDEIGDLPVHLQVKLLRVLQERRIQRVGSEREIAVDVRIMAATHQDLDAAMEARTLRRDLYYRLSVVTLTVPPLRGRRSDIGPLVENYLAQFREQLGRSQIRGIDEAAVAAMTAYPWPGNVRELINVIERAVLLCEGAVVTLDDLPEAIAGETPRGRDETGTEAGAVRARRPFERWIDGSLEEGRAGIVEAFEREYLRRRLEECAGNVGETARRAGIDPRTLYNKMRRLGLRKEDFRRAGG